MQVESRDPARRGSIGREAHALMVRLYPSLQKSHRATAFARLCRLLQEVIPLEIHEVPTGTRAYDWIVPNEWNVRDAYVLDSRGRRVIDFRVNNLHLAGYSAPIDASVSRTELLEHSSPTPITRTGALSALLLQGGLGILHQPRQLSELNEPTTGWHRFAPGAGKP